MASRRDSQKRRAKVMVVDDDPGLLRLLTIRLRAENYEVEPVANGPLALEAAARFRPDLVITDLRMEPMDGVALLRELQGRYPGLKVILLTAHGTIPDAVRATQSGAFSFLTKPVEKQELLDQVQKALKISGVPTIDEEWRRGIVTRSPLLEQKLAQAHLAAGTDARLLLTGEPGSGKESMARAIHRASARAAGPFTTFSCSATDSALLESELFGHVKGAFPGALRDHPGVLQSAEGGTLYLDDIADLPGALQPRLLRVVQDGQVTPLGGHQAVPVNVRLISATHRDLAQLVALGRFREDLYYKLNVVHIDVPPLARRREDIPLLVAYFLERVAMETGVRRIYSPEAVELLATADWPGNVHQLQAIVRPD
jgi:two-component system response regulator GlrR